MLDDDELLGELDGLLEEEEEGVAERAPTTASTDREASRWVISPSLSLSLCLCVSPLSSVFNLLPLSHHLLAPVSSLTNHSNNQSLKQPIIQYQHRFQCC